MLWAIAEPVRLSRRARELVLGGSNDVLVSAASAWEIATKHRLGKLSGAEQLLRSWDDTLRRLRGLGAPIDHVHALRAGSYDVPHRDPFDRLLAAHAELAAIPLVTNDRAFAAFPVTVVW
jgi:PIN domain nuclease of toxin-antitoxin system